MDGGIPQFLGGVDHLPCRFSPILLPADTTVAYAAALWTAPALAHYHVLGILIIPIFQATLANDESTGFPLLVILAGHCNFFVLLTALMASLAVVNLATNHANVGGLPGAASCHHHVVPQLALVVLHLLGPISCR